MLAEYGLVEMVIRVAVGLFADIQDISLLQSEWLFAQTLITAVSPCTVH